MRKAQCDASQWTTSEWINKAHIFLSCQKDDTPYQGYITGTKIDSLILKYTHTVYANISKGKH